jgi:hypothetical protein
LEKIGFTMDELVEIIQMDAQRLVTQYPNHPKEDLILTIIAMAIARNNAKIVEDLNSPEE